MNQITQVVLLIAGGCSFAVVILLIARSGRLTMRYTLGWLFVGMCIMIGGLSTGLVGPLADFVGVSSNALVITIATIALLALTVQLSITVSGLLEQARTLAEGTALLEQRIEQLGAELAAQQPADDGTANE